MIFKLKGDFLSLKEIHVYEQVCPTLINYASSGSDSLYIREVYPTLLR